METTTRKLESQMNGQVIAHMSGPEEVWMEVEMALHATKYPDVGVIEHLTTLDGIDCVRISQWMHFSTNIYPIYSKKPALVYKN